MLTQIHLINYKIIKIMLKIIFTFMDCLAKRVKILENMKKKHCMPWKTRAWGNKLTLIWLWNFQGHWFSFLLLLKQ